MRSLKDIIGIHESYLAVFKTKDGEKVIRHLIKKFGMAVPQCSSTGEQAIYREGQRSVVLAILNYINKDQAELIAQIEDALKNKEE